MKLLRLHPKHIYALRRYTGTNSKKNTCYEHQFLLVCTSHNIAEQINFFPKYIKHIRQLWIGFNLFKPYQCNHQMVFLRITFFILVTCAALWKS